VENFVNEHPVRVFFYNLHRKIDPKRCVQHEISCSICVMLIKTDPLTQHERTFSEKFTIAIQKKKFVDDK